MNSLGLNAFRHYSLNCVVSQLSFINIQDKPHLLILSHEKDIFILKWNGDDLEIVEQGNVTDAIGRLSKHGDKLRVLSSSKYNSINNGKDNFDGVCMSLYENLLKYLYIDPKTSKIKTINLKITEPDMIDFVCIPFINDTTSIRKSNEKYIIGVLYREKNSQRLVKIYEFSQNSEELTPCDFNEFQVDPQSNKLLALPNGNLIVFGGKTIELIPLFSKTSKSTVHFEKPTQVIATTHYKDNIYFLGTISGRLFKLIILDNPSNPKLELLDLGEISTPSDLEYLGDDFLYVASNCADSQIIKLNEEGDENDKNDIHGNQVSVYDQFESIAPIMDSTIVDFDMHGQGAMITCSGLGKDGSLRVVINGVNIEPIADTPLEEATSIFSLTSITNPEKNEYIVLSFPTQTMVLGLPEEELDRINIGFNLSTPTIVCATLPCKKYVQVTKDNVLLIDPEEKDIIFSWSPNQDSMSESDSEILLSRIYKDLIVVSTGYNIILLRATETDIQLVSQTTRESLVSCLDITENLISIGSWGSYTVDLLRLPDFMVIDSQILKDHIVPRSLQFACLEGVNYLIAGLGDGTLFYFTFDTETINLSKQKKIVIGTKPISLHLFQSNNEIYIFASSDRATIIFSQHKKLIFSNVNMKELVGLCSFNNDKVPNGLGLITPENLTIGQIAEIQNIQVKSIPLHCQPLKISFDIHSATVGVLTLTQIDGTDKNHFKLFQANTFEPLDTVEFDFHEYGSSIACVKFRGMESPCYVVGTSIVHPEEREPHQGRIYVFEVDDGKLRKIHKTEVNGAVYSLASFEEFGFLLSGVNSSVHLWNWKDEKLILQHTHKVQLISLNIKTRGSFAIIGDLIRSVEVLRLDQHKMELVEVARDCTNIYTTASLIIDDDNFLIVDNSKNAVLMQKSKYEDEIRKLSVFSRYHLGESVNTIHEGSLKMKIDFPDMRTFAYGSSNGAIGILAIITAQQYEMFQKVQEGIEKLGGLSLGNIRHPEFRAYKSRNMMIESQGFIDGDYIESFLNMDSSQQEEIAKYTNIPVSDLIREIEKMSRALV